MVHENLIIKRHLKSVDNNSMYIRFTTVDAAKTFIDWKTDPDTVLISDIRTVKAISHTDDVKYENHNKLPELLKLTLVEVFSRECPVNGLALLSGEVEYGLIGTRIKCQRHGDYYILEDIKGIIHVVSDVDAKEALRKLYNIAYKIKAV